MEKTINSKIEGLVVSDVGFASLESLDKGPEKGVTPKTAFADQASSQTGKSATEQSGTGKSQNGRSKSAGSETGGRKRSESAKPGRNAYRRERAYDEGPAEPAPSLEALRKNLPGGLIADEGTFLKACEVFERRVPAFMLRGMKLPPGKAQTGKSQTEAL